MKTIIYKLIFSFLSLCFVIAVQAQSLPDISYQDYGYSKPIKTVTKMYYSIEYAPDGSLKNIEDIEKITEKFDANGNIESYENQSFLDQSWAKAKTIYKKNRINKTDWTHSNPYLDRIYTYDFDRNNRLIQEKIKFKDGSKSHINFKYQNDQLHLIEAEIDGVKSSTERHYSQNGNLYKETHRQKVPGENDIVTYYYYLENQEILSYVAPKSYFYANAFLMDTLGKNFGEMKFKLIEDSLSQNKLLKGINRFETEAPQDQLPFDLQAYSDQTLQAFHKNKDELKPYRLLLYLRDENDNIIAEAEVDLKEKNISGIGFFQLDYADGTTSGKTEFQPKKLHIFEAILEKTQLLND